MVTPLILVTNDDGYLAPGIQALASALEEVGDVAIVAPEGEQSGTGRKITLSRPLRAKPRGHLRWSVDGTPTDCSYLALHALLDRKPSLVMSGINRGPNLAEDCFYSGTVAGAMEAASVGCPAVAVSLAAHGCKDYQPAAKLAAQLASYILNRVWAGGFVWNVNVPDTGGKAIQALHWVAAGRRDYAHRVTTGIDPRGRPYYWLGSNTLGHYPGDRTDCDLIEQGCATITPLLMNLTDQSALHEHQADLSFGERLLV
ncbi:MAG: 5'/3'-nucleotidase SurE [Myxococcota bacterium]|nr:5'/3'-nucleotidase SurE [Myxococcota bacterium]